MGIMLLLRLSQGISSGCHHATPTPFLNCQYCGKGALSCFDLAKVLHQGATMPPLHPFFWIVIIVGRVPYPASTYPRYFFRMSPRHPYTIFSQLALLWEGCIILLLRLKQGTSSGCHHATLHHFFRNCIIVGGGITHLLRLSQGISSGCHHATPYTIFWNCHYCGKAALCFCFDLAKVFLQMSPRYH